MFASHNREITGLFSFVFFNGDMRVVSNLFCDSVDLYEVVAVCSLCVHSHVEMSNVLWCCLQINRY